MRHSPLLACLCGLLTQVLSTIIGPGRGTWPTGSASKYGLNETLLAEAAQRVQTMLPNRFCVVVAREGEIISEYYFANTCAD